MPGRKPEADKPRVRAKDDQFGSDSVDVIRRLELEVSLLLWLQIKDLRSLPMMSDDLPEIAELFRATAAQLRRLGKRAIRTKRDTIVPIEAYLYKDQMRSAPAFPPDQCQEAANQLEEFADKLEALAGSSRQRG